MTRTRRAAPWLVVALTAQLVAGCGSGPSGATGPTAAGDKQVQQGKRGATLELRDRFLYEHNAAFFGGRTFRWVTPIPIYLLTGDPSLDRLLLAEAQVWEGPLAGVAGVPFYQTLGQSSGVPPTGIFFAVEDLPDHFIGGANPFFQEPRGAGARLLRQVRTTAPGRRQELRQVLPSGQITRCAVLLDPSLSFAPERAVRVTVRHEIGHCLGFGGHVGSGLMRPTCCEMNITSNVIRMLRRLYSLPPGTVVTP
jgi:hypothetical protein